MDQGTAPGRVARRSYVYARAAVVSVLIGVLGAGIACRRQPAKSSPERITLKIGLAVPDVVPRQAVESIAAAFSTESLVSVGFDGRPQPALAESWEPLAGGPGIRLKIRPNVVFHNGQRADAPSMARMLRQQMDAVRKRGWSGLENVKDITAPAVDQIEITYRRDDAFILPDLSTFSISDEKDPLLRTGPFRVTSLTAPMSLTAFDRYYLGRASIDAIELHRYQTQRKAWIALMRGEVDALHEVSRDAIDFVEAESSVRTYAYLRPYHLALIFNVQHPILARKDVRIAINEAVDRDAVIRDGMRGKALPAEGPIWPYHWAYTSAQRSFAFNPDAAKLRLDGAGLTRDRENTPGYMRSRFRFTCLVPSDDTRFERIALVIQRQLFEIGVDMEIEAVPAAQMVGRVRSGQFDAFLFEMASARNLAWLYRFWHSPSPGFDPALRTGYHGADEVLDSLRAATNEDQTRLAVSNLQRVLYDDPPAVFLAWPRETRAVDARFRVPYLTDRDVMGGLREWRFLPADMKASR